jgi:hypothetical protein
VKTLVAHCPYKYLADLKACLAEIRQWPGIVEPRPGVFYLGRIAFLHFHLKDGIRSADVRAANDWGDVVDIPIGASGVAQKQFLSEVKRRYQATSEFLGLRSKETKKLTGGSKHRNRTGRRVAR